jgi:DNA helicase-2/ATP-dependent DNA helicase PcrA
MPKIKPSPRQQAINEAFQDTDSNLAVLATAGSGKTTTLLGLLDFVPRSKSSIFLSFSNAIVTELKTKVPTHIPARTLHSLGFEFMRNYLRGTRIQVNEQKYFANAIQLYKEAAGSAGKALTKDDYMNSRRIESICAYARMTLTPFTEEDLKVMCNHYAIDYNDDVIAYSIRLLKKALVGRGKSMWIDFVDMIYFPVVTVGAISIQYDLLFLDEAQDTNNCQRAFIEKLLKPTSRLISVGDDYQSIYGFQGSNIESFQKLRERPNTVVLPLDVSYRCPLVAIRMAQTVCPSIQPHPDAIEGEERIADVSEILEGDMVLSRTTKPLIKIYFEMVKNKKKAKVIGKDIESGLVNLAETIMAPTKEGLIINMDFEFKKLEDELSKKGIKNPLMHPKYEALEDRYQVLSVVLENCDNMPSKLLATIHQIFNEDKTAAKLMTIHRAKGLENNRVFIVMTVDNKKLMPHEKAKLPWQMVQERNLEFVAYTRTRYGMYYLHLPK